MNQSQMKSEIIIRREVLNNSLDAFIGMDQNGFIFEWNDQAEFIFRVNRENAIGKRLAEVIIPKRFHSAHENGLKLFLKTGVGPILNKRIELNAVRSDGEEFPVELTVTPISLPQSYVFFAFIRDITEAKKIQREREDLLKKERAAREEAEQAVKARDEFLLVASHELKTPLTAVMLQYQMLRRYVAKLENRIPLDEKAKNFVISIDKQLNRLSLLITKLLDVSRISSGKLNLELSEVDLSDLIKKCIELLEEQIKKECYSINLELDQGIICSWDRMRMEQVVTNLLTNAMKYGKGKPIIISAEEKNSVIILKVKDQGIGISKSDQTNLFKKFERFVSSDNYPGLGLGLFITHQIVEAHGGSIKIESELDVGTTFIIEIPCRITP